MTNPNADKAIVVTEKRALPNNVLRVSKIVRTGSSKNNYRTLIAETHIGKSVSKTAFGKIRVHPAVSKTENSVAMPQGYSRYDDMNRLNANTDFSFVAAQILSDYAKPNVDRGVVKIVFDLGVNSSQYTRDLADAFKTNMV